ncbi:MAG: GIY-YIG nuclease family protein [Candidatus Scalindua sp.]
MLLSLKSHLFYYGSTKNLKDRIKLHNDGETVEKF